MAKGEEILMELNLEKLTRIIGDKRIIIYGAHQVAKDFYAYLCLHGFAGNIVGFAVSDSAGNPMNIDGKEVKIITNYDRLSDDIIVCVATPEKYVDEITTKLAEMDYENILTIGVKGLSLLENEDMIKEINTRYPSLDARQCENEYCCVELIVNGNKRRLLSLGAYPLNEKSKSILQKFQDGNDDTPGKLWSAFDNKHTMSFNKPTDIKVLVAGGYAQIQGLKQLAPYESPIVVGADYLHEDEICSLQETIRDNLGDNISFKNKDYAEMTATYWLWKNDKSDYKGLSHYRRRFVLDNELFNELNQGICEVVLSTPRVILPSLSESFDCNTSIKTHDFELIKEAVIDIYPEMDTDLQCYFGGTFFFPTNMVIARRDIFDSYCEWLFRILESIENNEQYSVLRKRTRYNAYIAEILTSFYFIYYCEQFSIRVAEYKLY